MIRPKWWWKWHWKYQPLPDLIVRSILRIIKWVIIKIYKIIRWMWYHSFYTPRVKYYLNSMDRSLKRYLKYWMPKWLWFEYVWLKPLIRNYLEFAVEIEDRFILCHESIDYYYFYMMWRYEGFCLRFKNQYEFNGLRGVFKYIWMYLYNGILDIIIIGLTLMSLGVGAIGMFVSKRKPRLILHYVIETFIKTGLLKDSLKAVLRSLGNNLVKNVSIHVPRMPLYIVSIIYYTIKNSFLVLKKIFLLYPMKVYIRINDIVTIKVIRRFLMRNRYDSVYYIIARTGMIIIMPCIVYNLGVIVFVIISFIEETCFSNRIWWDIELLELCIDIYLMMFFINFSLYVIYIKYKYIWKQWWGGIIYILFFILIYSSFFYGLLITKDIMLLKDLSFIFFYIFITYVSFSRRDNKKKWLWNVIFSI